jgi:acyl-CoA dehydrogenase
MPVESIYPQNFSAAGRSKAADVYFANPSTRKLAEFFEAKGLPALKQEDQREQWYDDWLSHQAAHQLYCSVLPSANGNGVEFDLPTYCRFLEVFGYFSPAHGYSLQVTSLSLFAILMGTNSALKQEALAALKQGNLLAFGVSEKDHGADLLANEFTVRELAEGRFVASGKKYYIGNVNAASIISIMAREGDAAGRRSVPILFALRPKQSKAFGSVKKIRTLGVRSAFVGEFEVKDHQFPPSDVIARGRDAWNAVFGAITLGKFFLAFGSIGICEHALREASSHLNQRTLYAKPAMEMPHLRFAMAQAYARLMAMKLYAYRTLDYVQAASTAERRYLLFCAVQKAKVSTEGVKVVAQLSECIGAKGFESDTYFEMALRDVQLFPGLEGSTHVNLEMAAQFVPRYFAAVAMKPADVRSLSIANGAAHENSYLINARGGALSTIVFANYLLAYERLIAIPNVHLFAEQVKAFESFIQENNAQRGAEKNLQADLLLGQCLATIAYAQLIAENAIHLSVPPQIVSAIFHLLINDLTCIAIAVASSGQFDAVSVDIFLRNTSVVPKTAPGDWDFISRRAATS